VTPKQKRFEFTPETVVCHVLVAQVGQKTVPNMWPSNSETPVAVCVVCATVRGTAHNLLVEECSRRRGPSKTKCMSSARYGGAWPDKDEKTKHTSL